MVRNEPDANESCSFSEDLIVVEHVKLLSAWSIIPINQSNRG